jgi:hypothetical protein
MSKQKELAVTTLHTSQPPELIEIAKRLASLDGVTLSEYVGGLVLADAKRRKIKADIKRTKRGRPAKR